MSYIFNQIMEHGWTVVAAGIVIFIVVAGLKANTEEHGGSKGKSSESKKESGESK
ncbi:MAG: hypothetical protein IJE43_19485 [Alphaproteobacteria bacterium]|nr:hypothetical protein [Alphaproteobacteria bacterium]